MYEFWKNIEGISMKCVGERFRKTKSIKPEITELKPEDILSEGRSILWIDINDITIDELQTIYTQEIIAVLKEGSYEGMCIWFTCEFPFTNEDEAVVLSTSPYDEPTHWKQTIVVLPTEVVVEKGMPVCFEMVIKRTEEMNRRYNIEFTMLDPEEVTHPEPCDCYMTKCIIIKKMLENYDNAE